MSKKRKLKSWKSDTVKPRQMLMRMVRIRADTADDVAKSVEVVIATENPVERFDEELDDVVQEILSMDGVTFRNPVNPQLPIVDSHDRSSVRNVLGSVRNVRVEGTELVGDAVFARDADSQMAFDKLKDGHLTDFSITATPRETTRIKRGETGIFRDEEIDGPVDVVTDWMPTDASLVIVGADELSTKRGDLIRSYQNLKRMRTPMDEKELDELRKRGMPDDVESTEDALRWAIAHMAEGDEEEERNEDEEEVENAAHPEDEEERFQDKDEEKERDEDEEERNEDEEELKKSAVGRALKADNRRRKEIQALCRSAKISRKFADSLCDGGVSLNEARKRILKRMTSKSKALGQSDRVSVTSYGGDRMRDAMRDGMIQRAATATGKRNPFATQYDPNGKPAEGYQDFAQMTLSRMAEEFLRANGINHGRMNSKDLAMVAMGHTSTINRLQRAGIMRAGDAAWHTTGSFTNLLLDAINKELRDGYEEAPFTWDIWARQGTSVQDLKEIHRIQFSEYPDLVDVPEGTAYPERKTSDAKESYKPRKKGGLFTITWETVINDDLDAISRIPNMQGIAARRKQNKDVYSVLTLNAVMADTGALFNNTAVTTTGGHNNLVTSSGTAISETSLNLAYAAMMIQPNLGGEIAGAVPKYLIVPPSISATAIQLVTSMTPPTAGGSAVGTSGIQNLYGPGGLRNLEVVVEAQLEANSSTAWYLAADKATIDTVELTFLAGEETPVLESEWDMTTDVYTYKIRQTYGFHAIDWRGLAKNDGA